MHPDYLKANALSAKVIGAAIEVHRHKGPGLIESIYERCLVHELHLQSIASVNQLVVPVEYKGLVFEEPFAWTSMSKDALLWKTKPSKRFCPSTRPSYFPT